MAPAKTTVIIPTAADFDVLQNRVAVALAKRERLVKSWTTSSARPRPPPKTQEELDAEDADLFNPTPAGLGLGASIPQEFLDCDVKRREISSNDKLRRLLLGNRAGLQASKPRDGKEKAISAKRGLEEESSDEDQGRSALGKAKKFRNGSAQDMTNMPFEDLAKVEPQQGIKSMYQENILQKPNHVSCPETEAQVKPDKSTEISRGELSLNSTKVQIAGKKQPLVDYGSDDESDYRGSGPIGDVSQKTQISKSNISTVSSSSTKTTINPKSTTPPILNAVFNKQGMAEPVKHLPHGGMAHPKKSSSKSGSSYSSKSRASSTESEPSDLETAIPLSLTPDTNGRSTIPATNILSPIEAKRAKKREKRARKREKDQQRKALALGITSGGAEKSIITSVTGVEKSALPSADGTGVAKKIKDRLRDASGN